MENFQKPSTPQTPSDEQKLNINVTELLVELHNKRIDGVAVGEWVGLHLAAEIARKKDYAGLAQELDELAELMIANKDEKNPEVENLDIVRKYL